MKVITGYIIIVISLLLAGCNLGHPTKTKNDINENELIGTYQYRNEYIIMLAINGIGKQVFKDKEIEINWKILNNELILSSLYSFKNGTYKNLGEQQYIISNDYRDYYYPFGSPDDFDNHEVWQKIK